MISTIPLADMLYDGAKEVFETMIFMSLEKPTEEVVLGEDCLLGTITFRGGIEGCLAVCLGQDCAKSIAVNMIGLDPGAELSRSEISDAVGEVANMVMGSFKSRILQEFKNVEVSIPSVIQGSKLETMIIDGQNSLKVPVMIDEFGAKLILQYKYTS
jgi:chemotaxis protein CheX